MNQNRKDPLMKPLQTNEEYQTAMALLEQIFVYAKPGTPEGDEFEALAYQIEDWERRSTEPPARHVDFDLINKVGLEPTVFEPMNLTLTPDAETLAAMADEDLPGITLEEINAVIREVRKERAARKAANPAAARAQDEAALADYLAGRTTDTRGLDVKIATERLKAFDTGQQQDDQEAT